MILLFDTRENAKAYAELKGGEHRGELNGVPVTITASSVKCLEHGKIFCAACGLDD